jgi:hypothetical protein
MQLQRRHALSLTLAGLLAAPGLSACQQNAAQGGQAGGAAGAAGAGKEDLKSLASSLQQKTQALLDAIGARNDAAISRAKSEVEREANRVEDATKSETGPAANRINAAVQRIRQGSVNNDVRLLGEARDLLQQAQQQ